MYLILNIEQHTCRTHDKYISYKEKRKKLNINISHRFTNFLTGWERVTFEEGREEKLVSFCS